MSAAPRDASRCRPVARLAAAALASCLASCAIWQPTTVPMRKVELAAGCAIRPDTLLVFLPGSYSSPEDFIANGFVAAVRARRIGADIVLANAHLGYYSERSIVERLHADVIAPARAAGYRHVWLIGISIGAFGALAHSVSSPAGAVREVDGIVAIAPYLGDRRVSTSIDSAGGLRAWPAPAQPLPPNEDDQTLWRWLQGHTAGSDRPLLYLGYGEGDRFAFSDGLLAAALPRERVFTVPGGHDWPTWSTLWGRIVAALPLPVDASCTASVASR